MKYLGAAYLIYLGLRALLARPKGQEAEAPAPQRLSQLCRQGFLVQLLNPKTALFFYAFLPQFVVPARGSVTGQILVFGLLFVLLASCTDSLYALLGSTAGQWVARHARIRRGQRYFTGGVYIALGLSAAFTGAERK